MSQVFCDWARSMVSVVQPWVRTAGDSAGVAVLPVPEFLDGHVEQH